MMMILTIMMVEVVLVMTMTLIKNNVFYGNYHC